MILAEDSSTQEEAIEKLTMWSGKFWCILQVFLNIWFVFCELIKTLHYDLETDNKIKYISPLI